MSQLHFRGGGSLQGWLGSGCCEPRLYAGFGRCQGRLELAFQFLTMLHLVVYIIIHSCMYTVYIYTLCQSLFQYHIGPGSEDRRKFQRLPMSLVSRAYRGVRLQGLDLRGHGVHRGHRGQGHVLSNKRQLMVGWSAGQLVVFACHYATCPPRAETDISCN